MAKIKEKIPIPEITDDVKRRFWDKVKVSDSPKGCWEWQGMVINKKKPYGLVSISKKILLSHRVSYFMAYGIDPSELCVLHKCDNPRCINPDHLFLGTDYDNVQDRQQKGRGNNGAGWNEGVVMARLWENKQCGVTKAQFLKAKISYEKKGLTIRQIAKKYSTCQETVSKALKKLGCSVRRCALSEKEVLEIRQKYVPSYGAMEKIAKEYETTRQTINDIVYRKTWKNI